MTNTPNNTSFLVNPATIVGCGVGVTSAVGDTVGERTGVSVAPGVPESVGSIVPVGVTVAVGFGDGVGVEVTVEKIKLGFMLGDLKIFFIGIVGVGVFVGIGLGVGVGVQKGLYQGHDAYAKRGAPKASATRARRGSKRINLFISREYSDV